MGSVDLRGPGRLLMQAALIPAYLALGWLATRLSAAYEEALFDIEFEDE